jgi:chromosomal replication initiation ATPase DnaA
MRSCIFASTFKGIFAQKGNPMNLQDIAEATAEHYGTTVEAMGGYSRQPEDVRPRQVYCYMAYKWTGESKSQIGRIIRRDHTTVTSSLARVAHYDISAEVAAIECVACIDWNAIAFTTNRNHEGPSL